MSYEFKRLGEVEALNEVPENANVLVEVGGAIKRVPGSSLGGGSSEVVILPETELTVDEGGEEALIMTPFAADLVIDGHYVVTYNGVDYNCIGRLLEMESVSGVILGNTSMLGVPGGNDNAPFLIAQNPPDVVASVGAYGTCVVTDGATTITLSIVQTEGGSGATLSGSYMFNATIALDEDPIKVDVITASVTEIGATYEQCIAALGNKQDVVCLANIVEGDDQFDRGVAFLRLAYMVENNLILKGLYGPTYADVLLSVTPDGATVMFQ